MNPPLIYVIGSLRNPQVPVLANWLRTKGYDVFDDWYAVGPEADDRWRDYELARGHTYQEALHGRACRNVYDFDHTHLMIADAVVLLLPAGKSAHLELGWTLGRGRPGYILLEEAMSGASVARRFDIMHSFATDVFDKLDDLAVALSPLLPGGSVDH
mgnify:CR=1 FL=1